MSILQFILIITGVIFFFFAIDSYERKKFNSLHFLVFFGGSLLILYFSQDTEKLNAFGSFFGVSRGADLLVYISIITLAYFYFELLNRTTKQSLLTTRMITEQAIQEVISHEALKNLNLGKGKMDEYIFLIRSYNEGKSIPDVIDSIINKGFSKILIVNDGSSDDTIKLVKEKKKQYKDKTIVFLSHLINRGGGSANKTGFEFLKRYGDVFDAQYVVTFDADGQMNIDDMDVFMSEIEKNPDTEVFIGSRFIKGGSASNISTPRRIILAGSRVVTYFFNSLWVTDPHNGYRVIRLDALRKINIKSDNMTYASEFIEELKRNKLKFKVVPVNIIYTEYSVAKGQKNSNAVKILVELIYNKFFYR